MKVGLELSDSLVPGSPGLGFWVRTAPPATVTLYEIKLGTKCRHIKEFHNSLAWSLTKVYLFGDQTHIRVVISDMHSLVCSGSWESNPAEKGMHRLFVCTYSTSDHAQNGPVSKRLFAEGVP